MIGTGPRFAPTTALPAFVAAVLLAVAAGPLSLARGDGSSLAADPPVSMIVPGGEAMKYWPSWRGPSGQGVVEGAGYPATWSDTENVLWRVPVPGRGHSSPIVWADRIFLTTAATDGSSRSVLCYRRSDGTLLWERVIPEAPAERLYPKNSYASSSPTTDGTLVYAYFGNGGVVAVDFNGTIAWHTRLGTIDLYHGPGGSPVLYKDRLILFQDQRLMSRNATTDPGFMIALDTKTGRELWRQNRTPQPGWSTPIAIQAGDRVEIIVSSSRRIEAVDPATGTLLWFSAGNTFEVIPMPVVGHGLVYCVSGRAGPTFAVRPGGSGDVTASHVVWSTPKGSSFVPSPLLLGDYLYTVNDMIGVVSCHHAKTGELVGQIRVGEAKREGFSASPVAVDGKVFFTNDDGETFVLSPAPDFKLLHVNRLGEQMLASPALVGGRWYIRTAGHLLAIGSGRALSSGAQGPPSAGAPAQATGNVKTMPDAARQKLDALLQQAVADGRPEPISVMIRPTAEEGADARVVSVLAKLGLKVSRTLSGGRMLVVTLKAEQLPDIASSADVARVSFDAFVTPREK